jgi:hypothetical protein
MGAGSTGDPDSPSPGFFPPHQFLTTMMKIALTIVLASTLVLAGCATSPGGKTDAPQRWFKLAGGSLLSVAGIWALLAKRPA